MEYQLPVELAQKLKALEGVWEPLREYLALREAKLVNSLMNGTDARDRDEVVAKMAILAKGGIMELMYIGDLPRVCKEICSDYAKRAEALNKN